MNGFTMGIASRLKTGESKVEASLFHRHEWGHAATFPTSPGSQLSAALFLIEPLNVNKYVMSIPYFSNEP